MSDFEDIQKALGGLEERIAKANKEQRDEINKTGEMSAELKKELSALNEQQKELGERLFDVEQKKAKTFGGGEQPVIMTVGADAVESMKSQGSRAYFSKSVGSFYSEKAITSTGDDSTLAPILQPQRLPGMITTPEQPLRIRNLLSQGRLSSSSLEYVRENGWTNNAGFVAEGEQKPESTFKFAKESVTTKVIAHYIMASKQAMSDAPQLQSYINGRLLRGLGEVEDAQFLNGDGEGDNLEGLNTIATAYDSSLDAKGDTGADKLAHALFQVTESLYTATGIVLNPRDWHSLALMKDGNGRYILGGPEAFAAQRLWGLPVVATAQQKQGTFTVGAFSLASQVWDQWDASITMSDSDRDNFVKNMLTILAEERLALAHYRPLAIVKGSF